MFIRKNAPTFIICRAYQEKGKNMRKLMILIAAGCMFGNYALAESSSISPKLTGDIEVIMKENSSEREKTVKMHGCSVSGLL